MDQLGHREGNDRGPFMLIVTPTRELASQIADTCMPIGKHTHHFVGRSRSSNAVSTWPS